MNVYKDNPQAGRWMLVLDWLPVEFGIEFSRLSAPFTGHIDFNKVNVSSNLPSGGPKLQQGQTYTFNVKVKNTGDSPQSFFLDPRLNSTTTMSPPDQNPGGPDQNIRLPLGSGRFPFYLVPTNTSSVQASLAPTGTPTVPVNFDLSPFSGDPDLEGTQNGNSASVTYNSGDEAQSGPWALIPSEIGPYPATGAPTAHANASFSIVTQAFDSTVNPSTGDMWLFDNGVTSNFDPVYLDPGQSATIPLTITPTASSGTHVSGLIDVDDAFQENLQEGFSNANADELSSLPFSYTVK